jgi:hypothetical protein
MRLCELFRPETIDDARNILSNAGYQEIGAGTWATIFHKPGEPFVLKLFNQADHAFMHYLNLITKVNNPHFPVIKGKPIRVSNNYVAVRMEFLQPMSPAMEQLFQQIDWDNPGNVQGDLGEALKLIHQYVFRNSGVVPDINLNSVMQRGQTMVIVDPAEPW